VYSLADAAEILLHHGRHAEGEPEVVVATRRAEGSEQLSACRWQL